jgi:mevalonate kinase
MEGHFHGTSSGMDPLVSYTGSPILHEQQTYHAIPPVKWPGDLQVCLIDSGMTRATGELVRQYLEWSNDETFASNCTRPLIQSVDHVISFLLDGHLPALLEHLHLISTLQYKYFRPMITENLLDVWERSFDSDLVDIKLCGAGGGGYYLAFVRGDSGIETLRQWTSCPVIPVPVVQI